MLTKYKERRHKSSPASDNGSYNCLHIRADAVPLYGLLDWFSDKQSEEKLETSQWFDRPNETECWPNVYE